MNEESDLFCVTPEEEGVRIDALLAQRFPSYSRTYFQHLLENGCVLLNGDLVKKRVCPEEGDEIEVCFQAIPAPSLAPENIPLEILYEDEHVLAINKPPGMVVHPAPGHWSGTFVNALLAHCEKIAPGSDPLRPGIIHRLDKETSGVMLAAKTMIAQQKLIETFAERRANKLYLAVCWGKPTNGIIDAPIGRHPVHRKEMAVLSDGREAISEVQLAASNDCFSLALVRPKTGRTHQIRVHLKHVGCPVIGDTIYGRSGDTDRLLLHAYQLEVPHPVTGDPLRLLAPIPPDVKSWMRKLASTATPAPAVI